MQRAIEQRGIPTVSITVARDVTEHSKPPRAVFVPFMMGHHFGVPFHQALQRLIITEALARLTEAQASGDIHALPLRWADARREGKLLEEALAQAAAR